MAREDSTMSSATLFLRNALGVPSTRIPIDRTTFVTYALPLLVCYFLAAVLAVTSQTRTPRLAFWPLVALLALRAALSLDLSLGKTELKFNNTNFTASIFYELLQMFLESTLTVLISV